MARRGKQPKIPEEALEATTGDARAHLEDEAIIALLSTKTIAEAAQKVKVSERTMRRMLADPDFRKRYHEARRTVFATALGSMGALVGDALEALRRNLKCKNPGVEVQAAKAILLAAVQAHEKLDLAEELARLEEAFRKGQCA